MPRKSFQLIQLMLFFTYNPINATKIYGIIKYHLDCLMINSYLEEALRRARNLAHQSHTNLWNSQAKILALNSDRL